MEVGEGGMGNGGKTRVIRKKMYLCIAEIPLREFRNGMQVINRDCDMKKKDVGDTGLVASGGLELWLKRL